MLDTINEKKMVNLWFPKANRMRKKNYIQNRRNSAQGDAGSCEIGETKERLLFVLKIFVSFQSTWVQYEHWKSSEVKSTSAAVDIGH